MAWIIMREKDEQRQMLFDNFRIDGSGTFRDPMETTNEIRLPLEFPARKYAEFEKKYYERLEPDWNYFVEEYLR